MVLPGRADRFTNGNSADVAGVMDKTTQVNFPVVPANALYRKLWRNSTSTDLHDDRAIRLTHTWSPHLKSMSHRPRNYSADAINRRHLDSPQSRMYPETPPPLFSSDSSMASSTHKVSVLRVGAKQREDECNNSITTGRGRCRCYDVETGRNGSTQLSNTAEGLSWRKLHMSRAKLRATATTSELLSGFAMIAMVELQINTPTNVPEWLFVTFAVCTTVLVAVHIFALMISTYILPNIEAVAKLEVCEMINESPHERMKGFIEIAWAFSTILGLFLFLIELAILCWVKFWDYSFTAAIAATVIVIPVLVVFVLFAVHFYHSLVVYKCNRTRSDMERLEDIKRNLDMVTVNY